MPDISVAMRALEHALAAKPTSSTWRSLVANRVQGLHEAYVQEMERGSAPDAFALDTTPWIHGRLQLLQRDQVRIVEELESLGRACMEVMDMEILRARSKLALQRVAHLRQRENDLLYESVDLDLGGEQ
jgi:hypothetical protein